MLGFVVSDGVLSAVYPFPKSQCHDLAIPFEISLNQILVKDKNAISYPSMLLLSVSLILYFISSGFSRTFYFSTFVAIKGNGRNTKVSDAVFRIQQFTKVILKIAGCGECHNSAVTRSATTICILLLFFRIKVYNIDIHTGPSRRVTVCCGFEGLAAFWNIIE